MKYYKYLDINTKDIAEEIKNYLLENPHLIEQGQGNWRLATEWLLENFPKTMSDFKIIYLSLLPTLRSLRWVGAPQGTRPRLHPRLQPSS